MRYYDIQIGGGFVGGDQLPGGQAPASPGTTLPTFPGTLAPSLTTSWTSFPNGVNDPGALLVEFDFFNANSSNYQGNSTVTIYGVETSDLQQASQYAGLSISIKAGMQSGLPLANAQQAGTIMQGQILQGFGNRQGTERKLDLVFNASIYTFGAPGNFVINWPKGGSLKEALTTALNVAFPNYQNSVLISDAYVNSFPTNHSVHTFDQLAKFVLSITKAIKPPGVTLTYIPSQNLILAYDGTVTKQQQPKQLVYTDFIGQPTWIDAGIVQFIMVMRADIAVHDTVVMPPELSNAPGGVGIAPGPGTQLDRSISFTGPFNVISIRHIGNSRDPNGAAWATVFEATPATAATQ